MPLLAHLYTAPATAPSAMSPAPENDYTDQDFLIGRQHFCRENGGNLLVRKLVERRFKEYERADKASDYQDKGLKKDKSVINKEIVAAVKQRGGRFLRQKAGGVWEEVSDKVASEKILELFKYLRKRNKKAADVMVPSSSLESSLPRQQQGPEERSTKDKGAAHSSSPSTKEAPCEPLVRPKPVRATPHDHHSGMAPVASKKGASPPPRQKSPTIPASKRSTYQPDSATTNRSPLGITAADAVWMSWQSVSSAESVGDQTIRVDAGQLSQQDYNGDMMNDDIMSISVSSSIMNGEVMSFDLSSRFSGSISISSASRAMSASSKMSLMSRPSLVKKNSVRSKASSSFSGFSGGSSALSFLKDDRRESKIVLPTEISTAKHGPGVWFALDYVLERLKDAETTDEDEATKFMAVLEKLTHDPKNHDMLMAPGHLHESSGVRVIVDTMRKFGSSRDVQVSGCLALSQMIVNDESRVAIERAGGFQALLDAQQRHREDETVMSNTFIAIRKLSMWHNRSTAAAKAAAVAKASVVMPATGLFENSPPVDLPAPAPSTVVTLPTGRHGITFWGTHHVMIAHIDDETIVPGLKVGMLVDAIEIPGGNLYVGMTTRELCHILKNTANVHGRLMTVKLPPSDFSSTTRGAVAINNNDGWSIATGPTVNRDNRSSWRLNPSSR